MFLAETVFSALAAGTDSLTAGAGFDFLPLFFGTAAIFFADAIGFLCLDVSMAGAFFTFMPEV